ncbi:MAG: PH domain-containing protein [Actinomycetaceae bacterium]|nr:PH domain-containing protein [Actinomycetaceae bacterium]
MRTEAAQLGADAVPASAWRKFHKATPLSDLGAFWVWLAGVPIYVFFDALESGMAEFYGEVVQLLTAKNIAIGFLVLLGISLLILGSAALSWKFKSFAVIDSGVHFRAGIIFKRYDHVRWDRIQSVEVQQKLLGRIFGFGSVKVDAAGYGEKPVNLGLLTMEDCGLLRKEILRSLDNVRRGLPPTIELSPAPGVVNIPVFDPDDMENDHLIYSLSTKRLVVSTLLTGPVIGSALFSAILVILALVGDYFLDGVQRGGLFFSAGIVSLPAIVSAIKMFAPGYGSTVYLSENGLRTRAGLVKLTTRSLPPTRIHAVQLYQPLLWRFKDWWRVDLTVAGMSLEEIQEAAYAPIPCATRAEIYRILPTIFPRLGTDDDAAFLHELLKGRGESQRVSIPVKQGRVLDPIGWTSRGVHANMHVLAIRKGRFWRSVEIIFQDHTQSAGMYQGPVQRRLKLATLNVALVAGKVRGQVKNFGIDQVSELLATQNELTKQARAVGVSESLEDWKTRVFRG